MNRLATLCGVLVLCSCALSESGAVLETPSDETALSKSLLPAADTFVRSGSAANRNFGGRATLLADLDHNGAEELTYLRFTVPTFTILVSAKLRVHVTDGSLAAPDLFAVANTTWSESSMTWNTRPSLGASIQKLGPASADSWIEVDVTTLVSSGAPLSLAIRATSSDSLAFDAKEATTNQPRLVLETATGPTPYGGTAVALPGTLEAARFDVGGEGVAYHDTTSGNVYDATLRDPTDVDIKLNGGAYSVGHMAPGEWLAYSVSVSAPQTFTLRLQVASGDADGGTVHMEVANVDVTGPIAIPFSGGYDVWTSVEKPIPLAAGVQVLRLVVDDAWFDLDAIAVSRSADANAISIAPGDDIQTKVAAAPTGAAFIIRAGVHRMQHVVPKDGQSFRGEPGAILTGARLLTTFVHSGAYWVVSGQTQEGPTGAVMCRTGFPRCNRPEDLFIDDVVKLHVGTLAEVGPGKWFFDYAADKIYLGDDPTGRKVETSVLRNAFDGSAKNVTIEGLVVEKYACPAQNGAIHGNATTNWLVRGNELRKNHGVGLRIGNGMRALGNNAHHNGQMGIGGVGDDALVEDNEIAFNNVANYNVGYEAGGTKFAKTHRLIVRGNYVHHNDGPGLWTDIDNLDALIEDNIVEDNAYQGIFHEISYAAVIRNNMVRRNGAARAGQWLYGAGILVAASPDVEVYGNTVSDNANGICAIQQNRGIGGYGPHEIENLYVHDNTVTMKQGYTGLAQDIGDTTYFTARNNRWRNNTYFLSTARPFAWMNGGRTEAEWKSYGQDTTGVFNR
jgi:parallel beta-helix repeat protein